VFVYFAVKKTIEQFHVMTTLDEKQAFDTPPSQGSHQEIEQTSEKHENHDTEASREGDGDGHVDWNLRQLIVTISLAIVYVGKSRSFS